MSSTLPKAPYQPRALLQPPKLLLLKPGSDVCPLKPTTTRVYKPEASLQPPGRASIKVIDDDVDDKSKSSSTANHQAAGGGVCSNSSKEVTQVAKTSKLSSRPSRKGSAVPASRQPGTKRKGRPPQRAQEDIRAFLIVKGRPKEEDLATRASREGDMATRGTREREGRIRTQTQPRGPDDKTGGHL